MKSDYRTKDLAESSFLLAKGKKLLKINKEGRLCWFIFSDKNECETLVNEFLFGNATISAKVFYEAIQTLKHKIFS